LKHQHVTRYATEANSKEKLPTPGKEATVNSRVASLVDQIASLTLIETSELIQLLKVNLLKFMTLKIIQIIMIDIFKKF